MIAAPQLQVSVTTRLIKWDGEAAQTAQPESHPRCKEIIELDAHGVRTLVYRRATDV